MRETEKAINGLEHCKIGDCVGCPYDQIREELLHGKRYKWELVCNEQLTEDILSLLRVEERPKDQPEIVRCKDCKHRPKEPNWKTYENGFDIEFPEGSKCPCQCSTDKYYSWYPEDDWFCANGERRTGNA